MIWQSSCSSIGIDSKKGQKGKIRGIAFPLEPEQPVRGHNSRQATCSVDPAANFTSWS
jgi:hypothetical protein